MTTDRTLEDKLGERLRRYLIEKGLLRPYTGNQKDVTCLSPDIVLRYKARLIKDGFLVPKKVILK